MEGARAAGTSTPVQRRCPHPQVGHLFAAVAAQLERFDIRPHLAQGDDQSGAQGIGHHVRRGSAPSPARSAPPPWGKRPRTDRPARRPGPAPARARPRTVILRPCAPSASTLTCGAEMLQQALGVVAARLGFDDGRFARRGKSGEQHRRLDLRRGHRRAIDDRDRIARAGERDRQPSAVGHAERARARSARADRGSASSAAGAGWRRRRRSRVMGQPATAPMTRRQPVPELPKSSTPSRRAKAADADAVDAPGALAHALDRGAERAHRVGGIDARPRLRAGPAIRVSPTASAPKIRARCEIDLSPGTRARPLRAPARRAVSGDGAAWSTCDLGV